MTVGYLVALRRGRKQLRRLMLQVIIALLPGTLAYAWFSVRAC